MAIADTVWGRLARFNAPRGRHDANHEAAAVRAALARIVKVLKFLFRTTRSAVLWLAPRVVAFAASAALIAFWLIAETVTLLARSVRGFFVILPRIATPLRLGVFLAVLTALGFAAASEMRSSHLQSAF